MKISSFQKQYFRNFQKKKYHNLFLRKRIIPFFHHIIKYTFQQFFYAVRNYWINRKITVLQIKLDTIPIYNVDINIKSLGKFYQLIKKNKLIIIIIKCVLNSMCLISEGPYCPKSPSSNKKKICYNLEVEMEISMVTMVQTNTHLP